MEIQFDKEAQDKLLNGINKLAQAVGSTMGPNGTTVIIPDLNAKEFGKYKVTKDGVSVAESIYFNDPIENIGAQLLKEGAQQTVKDAGDGTTTSTVLAAAFINNLKDYNTVEINKAFDEIIPKVIQNLKDNSKQLNKEDIKYVASISANNDLLIGELIQNAYNHSDIIKVEESNNNEDSLELIEGMKLDVSYLSKNFITNKKNAEVDFDNPHIIILDGKIGNLSFIEEPIQYISSEQKSLLIITEAVNENVLRKLESHVLSGNLKLCIIKSPGFSKHRQDLLRDISDFTGAYLIKDFTKNYKKDILGKLKSCKITKNSSLLIKDEAINIDEFINDLKELSKSKDLTDYDKELVNQRIEKLTGKVSIIKVGGRTENEMKERKDRYDDAVLAVACALEEGIVEGAGYALKYAGMSLHDSKSIINMCVTDSLIEPMNQIFKNGCELEEMMYCGSSSFTRETYFDQNIIDPLKVTRCALENAVSVAKVVLSTKAVVIDRSEWK